jgi:hypothetical protein
MKTRLPNNMMSIKKQKHFNREFFFLEFSLKISLKKYYFQRLLNYKNYKITLFTIFDAITLI